MDYRLQEQFDQYHSGNMSPDEISRFEEMLASDPGLKAENDFQLDIINGLKDYRKAELKSRLNTLDVSPGWIEFAQQSTLMKSFGGVAVATLIGAGVYLYSEPNELVEDKAISIIDAPYDVNQLPNWNIKPAELPIVEDHEPSFIAAMPLDQEEASVVSSLFNEEPKKEAFTLSFDAPEAEEIKDEESLRVSSLDELPEATKTARTENPIDVETELTKNVVVKYKYYDGKLFLSGDFDRAPYEILEINSASGRRIYVKYLDKYYKVGVTDKLTVLPEVTEKSEIEELKLLRKNK